MWLLPAGVTGCYQHVSQAQQQTVRQDRDSHRLLLLLLLLLRDGLSLWAARTAWHPIVTFTRQQQHATANLCELAHPAWTLPHNHCPNFI